MKRLLLIALLSAALSSQVQNSSLRIEQVMTPAEYQETGVASPSVQQKNALNRWFTNYTLRVLSLNQAPKPPSTTLPPSGCTPAIETRMEGEFNGWEPTSSPDMEPYLRLIMAEMREVDPTSELEEIRQLPLEKRYVWRVASALKWGFADFDSVNVDADRETLTPEDFAKVMDLLTLRPMQFCMFLKSLVGAEEMQRMMVEAINLAKQV
jgi:hypothetical protein